ncbi:hypothetical protein Cni_G25819 [Canna indica]|uniref:Plant basic secretory protein (BSP) family protein n=1 Tax=Canna indica TaxID=4628 RepID=A0AAQ3KYK4_9LILI|nr:hypothetical protein Cni_G25819 [Canna indica]
MSMAMEAPLLSAITTSSSSSSSSSSPHSTAAIAAVSTPTIRTRLIAALALVAISLWANYEASKSVDILVRNSAAGSPAERRFDLDFVSNGRAHRIIHRASHFVEQVLYPDELHPRKPVRRITLQLSGIDLPSLASVSAADGDYTIHLSPAVMSSSAAHAEAAVTSAVQRAVARVWIWDDGKQAAPEPLLEAMADYLTMAAGLRPSSKAACGGSLDQSSGWCWSAEFLEYCETRRRGFVARLNRGMRQRWSELAADDALGLQVGRAYAAYTAAAAARGRVMESKNATWEARQTM